MFIRKTNTNSSVTGEAYFTYRLVRGERIGGKVRQLTLLNLGRHFSIKKDEWPLLCLRIEQLLLSQESFITIECPDQIESAAQRYVGLLISRASKSSESSQKSLDVGETHNMQPDSSLPDTLQPDGNMLIKPEVAPLQPKVDAQTQQTDIKKDIQEVDINSLQLTQPRSVGAESLALHAMAQLGFVSKMKELGINGVQRSSIISNIVARMVRPASEWSTWDWLQNHSSVGELLDVDYGGMSHMALYRASDVLMRHRASIEDSLFSSAKSLFNLDETITLYDLTNTYLEGAAEENPKAKHGRSKEKRTDCPLLTLGLVLDGSGFVCRSRTFAGNVSEGETLAEMLTGLNAQKGAMVIMDAGIATEENLVWLAAQGYRYLVVRRGGVRQLDGNQSIAIKSAGGETVRLQKEVVKDGKEVLLYCHSQGREAKETAMTARFTQDYEAGLQKIVDGLQKPRCEKRYNHLLQRIGRLKEKSRGASQHYTLDIKTDESGKKVTALSWEKNEVAGTMATDPGIYCLRSNEPGWDEETLWRTYTMLTDLESVFRSLKGELGLRPVFHQHENRADGHLFITVLAYQFVQTLRAQLKKAGINDSWAQIRNTMSSQRRVTTSMRCTDGRTIHIRKCSVAEPALKKIYTALGINSQPGGTKKMIP